MKKLIFLALAASVSFSVNAKSKFDPDCRTSGFDNTTTCSVKPFGVYVYDKKSISDTVSLGGIWTSKGVDEVAIMIEMGYISANIDQLSFNIDGQVSTFKANPKNNKVYYRGRIPFTTGLVVIPLDYLGEVVKASESKYRITTLSNGYREGQL